MSERVGWSMEAYPSGKLFYPLDPRLEDINILDIAHASSNICRYGGHTPFYSDAEHCVRGIEIATSMQNPVCLARSFLMHDASEAYLGDVRGPIKELPEFAFYRELESLWMFAIAIKFNLSQRFHECDEVRYIDHQMLLIEQRDLRGLNTKPNFVMRIEKPWTPEKAKKRFMDAFLKLFPEYAVS